MFEIPNELARVSVRLVHSDFEFEICFGFRASDFGFSVWLRLRRAGDPLDSLMSRSADDCLCFGGWPGLLEAGARSDKSPLHRLSTGQRA